MCAVKQMYVYVHHAHKQFYVPIICTNSGPRTPTGRH